MKSDEGLPGRRRERAPRERLHRSTMPEQFVADSLLEGSGFEPSVPAEDTIFGGRRGRPARWPEPDFDDRRGQIYLVPCRACSDNDINAGSPSFRKDANAGPCQPARFRALARRVPGDSVLRSSIFETPRSVDTTITPSRMISRIRPTILSTA